MAVDPTDPETFGAYEDRDDYEEEPEEAGSPEAPEADTAEQRTDLVTDRDDPLTGRGSDEVNAADAAEQARVVELNEDEYR
ncbi:MULTISPECIES: hypothetical protein [Streptomyces]|uniref:DUF5709 domain-containing protein n=1 Tax=Streptomyces qinglanensis TaxID=943816 RepID=A0A1E7K945_9ACTN|nr:MULTISPECIES: hypothetical protein [Streptomyces]MBE9497862.1 hypothetical protein [Streptomyces sp. GKU 257-1]OEV00448.1 hypothetical protein AN217_24570 [Streptomyces qinglanensis]OEV23288.1 hypothetical protein AN220_25380 [Streptomyces nanshensis]